MIVDTIELRKKLEEAEGTETDETIKQWYGKIFHAINVVERATESLQLNKSQIKTNVDLPDHRGVYPDGTFVINSTEETECGKRGIPHRMKRFNCMDTHCINEGCTGRI